MGDYAAIVRVSPAQLLHGDDRSGVPSPALGSTGQSFALPVVHANELDLTIVGRITPVFSCPGRLEIGGRNGQPY